MEPGVEGTGYNPLQRGRGLSAYAEPMATVGEGSRLSEIGASARMVAEEVEDEEVEGEDFIMRATEEVDAELNAGLRFVPTGEYDSDGSGSHSSEYYSSEDGEEMDESYGSAGDNLFGTLGGLTASNEDEGSRKLEGKYKFAMPTQDHLSTMRFDGPDRPSMAAQHRAQRRRGSSNTPQLREARSVSTDSASYSVEMAAMPSHNRRSSVGMGMMDVPKDGAAAEVSGRPRLTSVSRTDPEMGVLRQASMADFTRDDQSLAARPRVTSHARSHVTSGEPRHRASSAMRASMGMRDSTKPRKARHKARRMSTMAQMPRVSVSHRTQSTMQDAFYAAVAGTTNQRAIQVPTGYHKTYMNVTPSRQKGAQFGSTTHPEKKQMERASYLMLEELTQRTNFEFTMQKSYNKLVGYVGSILVMFALIFMHWNQMSGTEEAIYSTMKDQLFDVQSGTVSIDGEVEKTVPDKTSILYWLESNVLDTIFEDYTCGDDECTAPEEYPHFQAHSNAREFVGCKSDCGEADTATVTINFFDPWKLQAAYTQVSNAQTYGWNHGEGVMEASEYDTDGAKVTPIAGWNVCSRQKKEYGFFENVCMFDGDIFIDGLPYRTDELENGNELFGESIDLELFSGEWELRIAFDGFNWEYNGQDVPIAFPAVRGSVCVNNVGDANATCETWNPCEAAQACRCEWWEDGILYCWQSENLYNWSPDMLSWVRDENLIHIADLLLINETYVPSATLNFSNYDDDFLSSWSCVGGGTHTLTMVDSSGDGWDGAFITITDTDADSVSLITTISTGLESGMLEESLYLCPDTNYAATVSVGYNPLAGVDILWFMHDTYGQPVARGSGFITGCAFYGDTDTPSVCEASPTQAPTTSPPTSTLPPTLAPSNVAPSQPTVAPTTIGDTLHPSASPAPSASHAPTEVDPWSLVPWSSACSFEKGGSSASNSVSKWCGFDGDWVWGNSTPSDDTGPDAAYDGNYFAYVEASIPNYPNVTLNLTSTALADGHEAGLLTFHYHLNCALDEDVGNAVFRLRYTAGGGGAWTDLWSVKGSQGSSWQEASVTLPADAHRFQFSVTTAWESASWCADAALDQVALDLNPTPAPTKVDGRPTSHPTPAPSVPPTSQPTELISRFPTPAPTKKCPADGCHGRSCAYWDSLYGTLDNLCDYSGYDLEEFYGCFCGGCGCDLTPTASPTLAAMPSPPPTAGPTTLAPTSLSLQPLPFACTFETGQCNFFAESGKTQWLRNSGSTPSPETGPSSGHNSTWYMYVESTYPNSPGKHFYLDSPQFFNTSADSEGVLLSFYYHLWNEDLSELYVETTDDAAGFGDGGGDDVTVLWSKTGNLGTSWAKADLSVPAGFTAFRFHVLTGPSFKADVAVDDVTVQFVPTTAPTISAPPTPAPSATPTTGAPSRTPTAGPTSSHAPTLFLDKFWETESLWTGWNHKFIHDEALLPFWPDTTSCDLSTLGDGFCDRKNNDMSCDYDGGDCCESTCTSTEDDDSACTYFDCYSPEGLSVWPYYTTNNDITYPFNTQEAFLDTMLAKGYAADYTSLPSLSCPNCKAYNDSYLAIPFSVRAPSTNTNPMFPWLNGTREREYLSNNRVLGGVLLTQSRGKLGNCDDLPGYFGGEFDHDCWAGTDSETLHFGADPTFMSTSDVYRATNQWEDYYDETDLRSTGLPYGFYPGMKCTDCDSGHTHDYPILFDVNFNLTRVSEFLTVIEDGNYVDDFTKMFYVTIPVVNYAYGVYVLMEVKFNRASAGGWKLTYNIEVIPCEMQKLRLNNLDWDDVLTLVMEVLFVAFWLKMCSMELIELRRARRHTGWSFQYLFDGGNYLDWANIAIQGWSIVKWARLLSLQAAFNASLRYDVYQDFYAVGALTRITGEMSDFQNMVDDLGVLIDNRIQYSVLVTMSLLVACLQMLKNLDFHPKMGLVTKTVSTALVDLSFWFLLYFIVNIIYAFVGVIVLGAYVGDFRTFGESFLTCQYMLLGIYDPGEDLQSAQQVGMSYLFYWSYVIITFFILLNALLAIIVDAYEHTKEASAKIPNTNAFQVVLRDAISRWKKDYVCSCYIDDQSLARAITGLCNNLRTEMNGLQPGTVCRVSLFDGDPSKVDEMKLANGVVLDKGGMATIIQENEDGTFTVKFEDGTVGRVLAHCVHHGRILEVKMPSAMVEEILSTDIESLKLQWYYYHIKMGSEDNPKTSLLSQESMVKAFRCLAPTMHEKIIYALTLNLLARYGYNADQNGDGIISPQEWAALEALLEGGTANTEGTELLELAL